MQGLRRILNSPVFFNFKHIELFPHIHGVSLVLSLNKYLKFRIKINNIK